MNAEQPPDPAADKSFYREAAAANIAWKKTADTVPDEARAPGPYRHWQALPVVLPAGHESLNLLPEARELALERFGAAAIPWHDGVNHGPSPHLLSSQVQCVNSLMPFVARPGALAHILATVLPIDEILPFGAGQTGGPAFLSPFDATDHVVFEWQGLDNHLNEWIGTPTRGAHATSADAAVRYRANDGTTEIALIEWKYTERYPIKPLAGGEQQLVTRLGRYQPLVEAPNGPIDTTIVKTADLFGEPVYQLMRLALLAAAMETAREQGAHRVRVVIAAPRRNRPYWRSVGTRAFASLACSRSDDLGDRWRSVLRRPDRFVILDTATLLASDSPCSNEYRSRYRHLAGATP